MGINITNLFWNLGPFIHKVLKKVLVERARSKPRPFYTKLHPHSIEVRSIWCGVRKPMNGSVQMTCGDLREMENVTHHTLTPSQPYIHKHMYIHLQVTHTHMHKQPHSQSHTYSTHTST